MKIPKLNLKGKGHWKKVYLKKYNIHSGMSKEAARAAYDALLGIKSGLATKKKTLMARIIGRGKALPVSGFIPKKAGFLSEGGLSSIIVPVIKKPLLILGAIVLGAIVVFFAFFRKEKK